MLAEILAGGMAKTSALSCRLLIFGVGCVQLTQMTRLKSSALSAKKRKNPLPMVSMKEV